MVPSLLASPALLATVFLTPFVSSLPNCPLLGPEFPPPKNLATNPTWLAAKASLDSTFNYLDASNITGSNAFSYSLQVWSTNPGPPILWEHHQTATNLPADTAGVKHVDGNTVYRLGSVTKAYTVLVWLIELGDVHWNQPVVNFVPELQAFAGRSSERDAGFDEVRHTAWDDVTIGALASQISGLGRDYGALGEILETSGITEDWQDAFPAVNATEAPPCGAWPLCTRAQFFAGLEIMYPSYAPYQTATYSDVAYQLLAYALENITGKNFPDMMNDDIIKPLNLNRTYYTTPPDSVGILPGTDQQTYWSVSLGEGSPGGNMYASPNDLTAFGRAVLSSQLVKPSITRRWLNPVSFTADFLASLGAPWGVRRIQLQKDDQPHRTLAVFTKAGAFQVYTSFLTILRDFNLGFTIQMAGSPTFGNFYGADMIGAAVIPAYYSVQKEEADNMYSGTYTAQQPSNGYNSTGYTTYHNSTAVNTTLTISTDASKPGLGITKFYSNGQDMIVMAIQLAAGVAYTPGIPEARLYYTQLESNTTDGGIRQSWKAVYEDTYGNDIGTQLWSTDCGAWVDVTAVTYDSLPLDEFIFNIDASGKVVSVDNLALKTTFYKQ